MPRIINRLPKNVVTTERRPGRHSDGGGLYLAISPKGAKGWVFIWKSRGKRNELGLGSTISVSLAEARAKALAARQAVLEGRNPILERRQGKAQLTFSEAVDAFLSSMETQWRNEKHRAQWRTTLTECCKAIQDKPAAQITTEDVLGVLKPIWATKHETASRLRGRIERVIDYVTALGQRSTPNPARWKGHLKSLLPKADKSLRSNHAALPYSQAPAFMAKLRASEGIAARALEFAILTVARSGETTGLRWSELDLRQGVWTVPAARMKAKRPHHVPLVKRAIEIAREMETAKSGDFVFPGLKPGKPITGAALERVLDRMKIDVTPHGFRSTFRDYIGDKTAYPRELAEQALAHQVGDATERAYRRGDALDRRREMMDTWAKYLSEFPVPT